MYDKKNVSGDTSRDGRSQIFICLNLLLDKKVMVGDGHIWERCALLLISLVVFLAVSVFYEKSEKYSV